MLTPYTSHPLLTPQIYSFHEVDPTAKRVLLRGASTVPHTETMLVQGREALAFVVNVSVDCSDVHGAAAAAGAAAQVLPVMDTIYGNMAQVASVVDTALATALTSGADGHLRTVISAATLTINLADCTGADDSLCAGMAHYVPLFCPALLSGFYIFAF